MSRVLGIDIGAETVKIVELHGTAPQLKVHARHEVEHHKDPRGALLRLLSTLDWDHVDAAAATGRASRSLKLLRVPTKAALARGVRQALPKHDPGTVVSIGSHGFSVLELREGGHEVYRENSRCSQGTGNFLRQLVERFNMTIEEASELCAPVDQPAALSGRCPVILKTDMTHLANKGEDRARILAGLYDAVCENVQVLIKPHLSPRKVVLTGGVTRSVRVVSNFRRFLSERDMELVEAPLEDTLFFEALGAASFAAEEPATLPALADLFVEDDHQHFEAVPGLRASLEQVHRMPFVAPADGGVPHTVVLGFDIGSTGSKAVAIDLESREPVWQGYVNTLGNPVAAAKNLAERFLTQTEGRHAVHAVGATGSGREIVGSLISNCFGPAPVFVLNEIAAHAEGALHFDPLVDTIFEIGGQDAKYIRLDHGRISDAAMNEACSAGTGSFIEEQGRKFEEVEDVVQMADVALDADHGIGLGQHCSVFMAEVIDEAVAAGVDQAPILAGIYDSIIQNYLNRVKGNRSVGDRIFCQGMPFASDALAAAVARQTGRTVIVPPDPGTIGALGIALLAAKEAHTAAPIDLGVFLSASVDRKDTFICKSTKGCGGAGNKCRIDRIYTTVAGKQQRFVWGGNCSLYDRGTSKRKLPDRTPDPFRARRELLRELIEQAQAADVDGPTIVITDEFALKTLFPFFSTYLHSLGYRVKVFTGAGPKALKRGVEESPVPYCAPMQIYQGVMAQMLETEGADLVFVPRVREIERQQGEINAPTCPIVQASPDVIRRTPAAAGGDAILLTPRIDVGPGNLRGDRFRRSIQALARSLGITDDAAAMEAGLLAQERFEAQLYQLGREALEFAHAHDIPAVVVLGRAYTIHNDVLNSNVPNILREQGAIAIPVDCYPVDPDVPVFEDLYWGYAQLNLRAAHQVRRSDGVWSVYCSNYSCGPDSFNLHFFAYTMEHKPFAIIETDGHSGDAGTKTRIEAFLYTVEGDRRSDPAARQARPVNDFKHIEDAKNTVTGVQQSRELLIIPRMGASAELVAEVMNAEGIRAECMAIPDREALRLGRRHTSGKECVPMTITLGSMLQRIEASPDERFALMMPTAPGPCRFGVYNLLHKIVAEKTGLNDNFSVVSPSSSDYFAGTSASFRVRALIGIVAADMMQAGLYDVRPVERVPGATQEVYDRGFAELKRLIRRIPPGSLGEGLSELAHGMYGVRALVEQVARDMAELKDFDKDIPTVSVVGEIYVRLDPFANGFVVEELEKRGIRALVAPFVEWLEYTSALKLQRKDEGRPFASDLGRGVPLANALERATIDRIYTIFARALRWPARTAVPDALDSAEPWISRELYGEAVLTLGGPLHEHMHGLIDGVVAVGPHECMPTKVAESQFVHVGEKYGLLSLTLPLNGDPVDPELLDRFAFEVKQRFSHKKPGPTARPGVGTFVRAAQQAALLGGLKMLTPFRPRRGVTPEAK